MTEFTMPRAEIMRTRFRFPLGAQVLTADGPGRIVARHKSYAVRMPYDVALADGTTSAYGEDDLRWAPVVGLGATMHYPSDSLALVIVKVTAKTIVTQRVETTKPETNPAFDVGGWGLTVKDAQGILDRPIPGTERRWHLTKRGTYTWQGMRLSLGYSVTRRDWRN